MGKTLWQYYLDVSRRFHESAFSGLTGLEDWQRQQELVYQQHLQAVGLDSPPEKSDLAVQWYGELKGEGYVARKLSYQLLPDCHGTAIVFYPDPLPAGKLPGVLYCCGHSPIGTMGYSKQGIMWARRGYVCLVFDTIQQGDNPGQHGGIGGKSRYDWMSMGYCALTGEIWNSVRALDVLLSLPEVDPVRVGATGISGGGSLSFRTAVVDRRIAAVASCSGVPTTYFSLKYRNFLGHCDCMYVQNTPGRDTSEYAATIAPRPLLFCYGHDDALYSEPEFFGMRDKITPIYEWYGCPEKFKVHRYVGPHGYTEDSINQVNLWFDKYVAGEERPLLQPAEGFDEQQATIFNGASPQPNRTFLLPELLSHRGVVQLPADAGEWSRIRANVVDRLRTDVFHRILGSGPQMDVETVGNWTMGGDDRMLRHLASIDGVDLVIDERRRSNSKEIVLCVTDFADNAQGMVHLSADFAAKRTSFIVEGRGCGTTSTRLTNVRWDRDNFLRQAGSLVGIAPLQLMIQDTLEVIRFIRKQDIYREHKLVLYGIGDAAVACLYAAILDDSVDGVVTHRMVGSHLDGGYIPGILRVLDIEQACGMLAPRPIALIDLQDTRHNWPQRVYSRLGIPSRLIAKCQSADSAVEAVFAQLWEKHE